MADLSAGPPFKAIIAADNEYAALKERCADQMRLIAMLVEAAGGEVTLHRSLAFDPATEVIVFNNPNGSKTISVNRSPAAGLTLRDAEQLAVSEFGNRVASIEVARTDDGVPYRRVTLTDGEELLYKMSAFEDAGVPIEIGVRVIRSVTPSPAP